MFTIERAYLQHTGGTKFYQPFLIHRQGDDLQHSATLIHFGPNSSAGAGRSGRPVLGGQTQVKKGASHFYSQIEAKKKESSKGRYVETGSRKVSKFDSISDFRSELMRLFGASTSEDILLQIGVVFDADGSALHPSESVETIDSEPKEKPAEWGSW